MRISLASILLLLCLPASHVVGQEHATSFTTAKNNIYTIHQKATQTFYCDCSYSNRSIIHEECTTLKRGRFDRTEVEHVVPASVLGKGRECWRRGGRNECERNDALYRQMSNDLINLRPSVGGINLARSNYTFGEIAGEHRDYGSCDFEVDRTAKLVEPAPHIRGDIARIYQYMSMRYRISLTSYEIDMYQRWAVSDPVSESEWMLNEAIERTQGTKNCFVSNDCQISAVTELTQSDINKGADDCKEPLKRYCSQMIDCNDALYHLSCGVTSLDGDKDGVPCESLCK